MSVDVIKEMQMMMELHVILNANNVSDMINDSKNKNPLVTFATELGSNPLVKAASQFNLGTAAITSLLSDELMNQRDEYFKETLSLINSKIHNLERKFKDFDFYSSEEGKNALKKGFASFFRDSRKSKIKHMLTLLANLSLKTIVTYDERELFIDILDSLNSLQLTVLGKIFEINNLEKPNLRKFEPSRIVKEFEKKGIDSALIHQAISILSTHYLVNRGIDGLIGGPGNTYHFTQFGEKFYVFVVDVLAKDSPYLLLQNS